MSLWAIPAIMSVFGGMQEHEAGQKMEGMAQQQRLLAEKNAALEAKELAEDVRRQGIKNAQVSGAARARASASGATLEGTPADYLAFIDSEQSSELKWMKEAGASRIKLRKQYAMMDADSLQLQAEQQKMGLYTGVLQGVSFLGEGGLFS